HGAQQSMTVREYFWTNGSKVESSTLTGCAGKSAISVNFNPSKSRPDIYLSLEFPGKLHLTLTLHQPRDPQHATKLQLHQILVQLSKAYLSRASFQFLVQLDIRQRSFLLDKFDDCEGHCPRAPDIVQVHISPGRPDLPGILSNRDRSSVFLEPLAKSLIPVLHVRSNRWLDPFQRVP